MADRVASQNMGISLIGLAQGIPFFQMGSDILRSKSLDRNSYDSGDWFNRVYWDSSSNNFGVGLPPAWDNQGRWQIMAPLLADGDLNPTAADMNAAAAHLREILRIRKSSPLFRMTSEASINARTWFYNTGQDGLIVMALSDAPEPDLDARVETILVFFNANKISQTVTISGAAGFTLHPLQADSLDADPVVQTAGFDEAAGAFTIPARTTAVFVSSQSLAQPLPPSTLDWVGDMFPRGGVANEITQGAADSGLDVYVQVYEPGVTEAAGEGATAGETAAIACSLHWGVYGSAWNELPMTWNVQKGNNDEYKATLSQAMLNTLAPGTYGFTASCRKAGEAQMWRQDERRRVTACSPSCPQPTHRPRRKVASSCISLSGAGPTSRRSARTSRRRATPRCRSHRPRSTSSRPRTWAAARPTITPGGCATSPSRTTWPGSPAAAARGPSSRAWCLRARASGWASTWTP